ncbi:MAG: hypothetical protein VYA71_07510 [Pseudomonadota bacterium]|nr:hypothetical protein [Pseudomonadota bacterium]
MTEQLTTIAFAPLIPGVLCAVLALLAVAGVGFGLWRRARGIWWRALGMGAAVAALLNPVLVEESRERLADVAVVVVDQSSSQRVGDRASRAAVAADAVMAQLEAFQGVEARVVHVGGEAREVVATVSGTALFSALSEALSDVPRRRIAGAVLVTDGQVHDVPDSLADLGFDAPVHALITGDQDEADRRLVVEQAPRYGIVGNTLTVTLRVEDSAEPGGPRDHATLTTRVNGGAPEASFVPIGDTFEIGIPLDRAGATLVEFDIDDGPVELSRLNNRAVVAVNGVRDRLRVLLISGEAHTGERVWRNLLKSDPSVDLVHFTILRPPEKQDATPIRELALISFPIRELFEVKLNEFDLIIFDRYRRRGVVPLSYLDNIAAYVKEGGALLSAAGPSFAGEASLFRTPLGFVLPGGPTGEVFEGGFRPRLTDIGRRHPVTAALPGAGAPDKTSEWGRWFRQVDVEIDAERGASTAVLMEGVEDRPILLLDRVEEGRVAQLLTDHMWLWARGFEGGGPQAELLRRVAHWLMKEPDLEEEDLRATVQGTRLEITRRSLSEGGGEVIITTPTGEQRQVDLEDLGDGRAGASATVVDPGLYRLDDGIHSTIALVGDVNPPEFADLRATETALAPLVRASGGAFVWLANEDLPDLRMVSAGRDSAGRGWIGLRANHDYRVTGIHQAPLMAPWLVLLLTLGGLMLAWRDEGR